MTEFICYFGTHLMKANWCVSLITTMPIGSITEKNLLQRIHPGESFLALHHNLDIELSAIKSMCSGVSKQIVLLEGLDCLITYLQITSGSRITLFWKQLEETRKLERLLWILLPQQLAPKNWPLERIKRIPSG